ncbi:helix-turn-helix domain-containing protein [Mucilaginibacter panaciglaebae]|uniref:Homeodomain-like domain-containing protein n=1 Tax=Mucilaginibacter panaciglaebae TaxID=502331 RepID=A0ABP7WE63_9SPHI
MQLHIGEIVEMAVRRKGVSISELSRRMHVNRRSIYNWFQQRHLKIEMVCEIGYVIGHDFSQDLPDDFARQGFAIMENLIAAGNKVSIDSTNSVHFWMTKYIDILEKYNELLQTVDIHQHQEVVSTAY